MKKRLSYSLLLAACMLATNANATNILLSADNFAVFAGQAITNTGPTLITGDIGVGPGTAITGFPPGAVTGTIHDDDGATGQAQLDLTTAYNSLAGMNPTQVLPFTELGGLTFTQGVYKMNVAAELTGTLTLSGPGTFIFQIGSSFLAANQSAIELINGASAANLYFQVGSSETVGTDASLQGNIVALTSISIGTGSTLLGRALALNGVVTLNSNQISLAIAPDPEPGTILLLGSGLISLGFIGLRKKISLL